MDLRGAKAQNGPKLAWARTGALILFLVTGILLVASLNSARSQAPQPAGTDANLHIERT
jgi:hypothetical protein